MAISSVAMLLGTSSATTYTTWNSADKSASLTLSGGDLVVTRSGASGAQAAVRGIAGKSSGKWYFEITYTDITTDQDDASFGVGNSSASLSGYVGSDANGWGCTKTGAGSTTPQKANSGSKSNFADTATWADGSVFMVALDISAGKVWFGVNGTWFGSGNPGSGTNEAYSGLTGTLYPMVSTARQNDIFTGNFGTSSFSYSAPSGFTGWTA